LVLFSEPGVIEVYASSGCRMGGAFSPIVGLIILGTGPIGLSDVPYVQGNTQLDVQYEEDRDYLGFLLAVLFQAVGVVWRAFGGSITVVTEAPW